MTDDAKDIIFKLESLGYDHSEAVSELQIVNYPMAKARGL